MDGQAFFSTCATTRDNWPIRMTGPSSRRPAQEVHKIFETTLADESATMAFGARLAARLARGDCVALSGPLGAGKTTLARGVIEAIAGERDAPSPTFGLAAVYDGPTFGVWHFDLYRVETVEEIDELGIGEALDQGVALIEWAERMERNLPRDALIIRLDASDTTNGVKGARRAQLWGDDAWRNRLSGLNAGAISGIAY